MASGNSNSEENEIETSAGRYEGEGSDSYYSNSSSQSTLARIVPPIENVDCSGGNQDKTPSNENSTQANPGKNPPLKCLFNPNEKGSKKQKRSDYDSDERSYDGLGVEYKRRNLHNLARRNTLLPEKSKMVDFGHQETKKWGNRLLFETVENPEIDTLVAFATSYDPNSEEKKMIAKNITGEAAFHDPQHHNPLLSATHDSPLPPSHIDFVKSRAFNHTFEPADENQSCYNSHRKSIERNRIGLNYKDELAVAMSIYLEESLTASMLPLAGLHVIRCQALEAMASAEIDFGGTSETHFVNSKGNSEELRRRTKIRNDINWPYGPPQTVIHPISGEKVKLDANRQIRWKDEDAFLEWTLPPEEAIFKLKEQGFLAKNFPYHFIPDTSRFWTSEHVSKKNYSNCQGNFDLSSLGFSVDDGESYIKKWAKKYMMNQNIFSANREIFDIFLPQKVRTHEKTS